MKTQLLKHAWLQFSRSPTLTRNIIQTVILGIFGLYIILSMLGLAFVLREVVEDQLPGQDLLLVTGGLVGYYFVMDLLMRFFVQKFPSLAIKPYLPLRLKKDGLAHYLLFRSLGSFFNILPFFFFIPFFFKDILPFYPATAFNFAIFFVGMVLFNHFLSFGIAKNMGGKNNWSGLIIIGVMGLFFLEYKGYFSLFEHLKNGLTIVLANPIFSSIPLLLSIGLYFGLHRSFRQSLYLENTKSEKNLLGANLSIGWFDRFGDAGKLMDLELKLILRSKRARAYLITSLIFVAYPLLLVNSDTDFADSPYILLMVGFLITGMMGINHGQILLSWNSLHFDLLMSRGHTIKDIFKAKYYFLTLSCLFAFVLSLPYFFLSPQIVLYSAVMLLYNLSFSLFGYLFLASYTALRVDPNEGGAMSFNGFGAAHYLIIFPIMGLPFLMYLLGDKLGGNIGGLFLITFTSVLLLIFYKTLLDLVVNNFKKHRYKIAAAFRKKD